MKSPTVWFFTFVLAISPSVCHADKFRVSFRGEVSSSFDTRSKDPRTGNAIDFAPFVDGTSFQGSFLFDSDLIESTNWIRFPSGGSTFRNYSAIRDYAVRFDIEGPDYVYSPPLFAKEVFPDSPLGIWSVNISATSEGVSLIVPNYPAAWWSRPPGVPIGMTPEDQYIGELYPHNSFFSIVDRTEPLDVIGAISNPNVDVQQLFNESASANFTMRFTDPFHPDWQESREALVALVRGTVTSLQVTNIPEQSTLVLAVVACVILLQPTWRN